MYRVISPKHAFMERTGTTLLYSSLHFYQLQIALFLVVLFLLLLLLLIMMALLLPSSALNFPI